MIVYIMRHGQTDWNLNFKMQGRTDIPLNETGEQMAIDARERYQSLDFDVCYSSPLIRAVRTAELFLSGRDVPVHIDERLTEMCFGIAEGGVRILDRDPSHPIYNLFKHPELYTTPAPEAESLESLYTRTGDFIRTELLPYVSTDKKVLIIGHGAMNLSIINQLLEVPVCDFWKHMMGNCVLLELRSEADGRFRILQTNDEDDSSITNYYKG